MTLRMPKPASFLKDGHQMLSGLEEATIRNIHAVAELTEITRTSFGPNGRNKMVINHLEKLFVTNDAATILRELEVVHPAAKILVMASQQQEAEMGDASNLVLILAGELLKKAEGLLTMGLHPSEVIAGYELARDQALKEIENYTIDDVKAITNQNDLAKALMTSIASKQYGYEALLAPLVAEATLAIMPKVPKAFNVDSVRVVKIMGGSIWDSRVVRGMVFGRQPEGTIRHVKSAAGQPAKVAIFTCPLDIAQTETKGTVLIKNADQMLNFTRGEEKQIEKTFKELADAGIKAVISGANIGELAQHYLNRFGILSLKVLSKFELRRLCRVVGATPLARLGVPMAEEMGHCDVIETIEIGGDRVTVFRQGQDEVTKTATIVLRGATQNSLDDVERSIDDAVNTVKQVVQDGRMVPGAGATELALATYIQNLGDKTPGIGQHALRMFGQALEVVPRTLAENAGYDATVALGELYAAQDQSGKTMGIDVENDSLGVMKMVTDVTTKGAGILDLLVIKKRAIRLACDAAMTILSIDQIIMSKAAGGPAPPKQQGHWDDQD